MPVKILKKRKIPQRIKNVMRAENLIKEKDRESEKKASAGFKVLHKIKEWTQKSKIQLKQLSSSYAT